MKVKQVWESAIAGSHWLMQHQNPDGSWVGLKNNNVDAFYKVSWALSTTGKSIAAHRSLNYAVQHFITGEADFLPREHPSHKKVHYLYPNAYFIVGSMLIGRYEIGIPAVRFLLSKQDSLHGGFYSLKTEAGTKSISDTMTAGAAGLACLAAGQINAAQNVADYLAYIVDLQPTPNECFFTTIYADGRLLTNVTNDSERFIRIIDTRKKDQCWYAVGLPFAFLIRFAEATGEARYFDQAQWYFDFQRRCVNPWDGGSSGKAGWGCAILYRITGESLYRDIALHIADNIMRKQNADGGWRVQGGSRGKPSHKSLTNADVDITAEYTLWLALISTNILAYNSSEISDISTSKWRRILYRSSWFLRSVKSNIVFDFRRLRNRWRRILM